MRQKNVFLFLFLAVSVSAFAQRKLPTQALPAPPVAPSKIDSTAGKAAVIEGDTAKVKKRNPSQKKGWFGHNKLKYSLDTLKTTQKNVTLSFLGFSKPKTALILSIIPGAGQVYNKKYWKVPIVWGALAGMGYLFVSDYQKYSKYRLEYLNREQNTRTRIQPYFDESTRSLSTGSVQSYRDQSLSSAEFSGFGLLLVYALQGVDAFVDAHLATFDMSDDLSVRFKPSLESTPLTPMAPALGLSFTIGKRNAQAQNNSIHF